MTDVRIYQSLVYTLIYTHLCTHHTLPQTCAHRYTVQVGDNTPYPVGRCFFSGRNLQGFTEYSPCRDGKVETTYQFL